MTALFIVVPLALLLVIAAVATFVWAVRNGQFDDMTTPACRVLFDDVPKNSPPQEGNSANTL